MKFWKILSFLSCGTFRALHFERIDVTDAYVDYALESINDWIIYENNLDKDCITHRYQMAQELKRMGITMK